jgi:hypothetical protein
VVDRRLGVRLAAAITAAVCLAGCTSSSSPKPSPTATSPSPSPSATTPVAQRLQQLAALGTKAVFHGSYVVRQRHPSSHATWRVWRTKHSLRVDVVTKHVTATLISTPRATYSCRRSGHRKTCFRVAKGDQPIPVPVRLSAEQLFSTDLDRLANHPNSYTVSVPAAGSVPVRTSGAECFRVTVPKKSKVHLETATYCLSDAGIINAVVYPSGNIVRVQSTVLKAPKGEPFHPYSSPTPLPG